MAVPKQKVLKLVYPRVGQRRRSLEHRYLNVKSLTSSQRNVYDSVRSA